MKKYNKVCLNNVLKEILHLKNLLFEFIEHMYFQTFRY